MLLPLPPSLCVEGTFFPCICFGFKLPGGINILHGNSDHDSIRDGEVPVYGLALGVLYRVDVLGDALVVNIKGDHLNRHLDELGVLQYLITLAEMADELAGRDGGVDCAGMTELLVPCQEFGDASLRGEEAAPIRLLSAYLVVFWRCSASTMSFLING